MSHTALFQFSQGGQEAQVVLEWDESSSISALVTSMAETFWPAMQGRTSAATTLEFVQVGDASTGEIRIINETGGGLNTALPPTCAALVNKTVSGSRDGRFFWPGVPEQDVAADGRFTVVSLPQWNTAVDTAFGATSAAGHTMVVTNSLEVENPVTALTMRQYIGTQRRRLFN